MKYAIRCYEYSHLKYKQIQLQLGVISLKRMDYVTRRQSDADRGLLLVLWAALFEAFLAELCYFQFQYLKQIGAAFLNDSLE